jgi:hypothetical protein
MLYSTAGTRTKRRMEGKRVAAAATLYCMLIKSSCCQPASAGGRVHPGWFCTVKCLETCTAVVSDEVHNATFGAAAGCSEICSRTFSICGVAQSTDGKVRRHSWFIQPVLSG